MPTYNPTRETFVVGNSNFVSDSSVGYKNEVKQIFESYQQDGVAISTDLMDILSSPSQRAQFVDQIMESMTSSPVFTDGRCSKSPFYSNYTERFEQLLDNSLQEIAKESAMIGYAPIVAYNPFFLKKQWVDCVFKDVVMTEVPASPVINLAYEKRYLKDLEGNEYPIPEATYDDALMKRLLGEATGLAIKEDPIAIDQKNLYLLNDTYIPGIVVKDKSETLTADIMIFKVFMAKSDGTEVEVPVNIRTDVTTHNFVGGKIKYDVKDDTGVVTETLEDEIIGNVNFREGKITVMHTGTAITKFCLRGKCANRFNARSLDVVRRVEQVQHVMPESGPRFNSPITIEDAADALALQKIDVIADNVDVIGRTLGEFEDFEIRNFLDESFDAQERAGVGPHGYEKLTVSGTFDALPYDGFTNRISEWMKDSREYFERIIGALKIKLKTPDVVIVCVCHPNLIRFLNDGINWVFSDDTQISGAKISYNFGVMTSAQDRVHFITSMYMPEDNGIKFVTIPLTKELVTYKHYKYNAVIDRGYRSPLHSLTPNIMVTHRTLTFEVLPVQGNLKITGRDLFSPDSLKRASDKAVTDPTT